MSELCNLFKELYKVKMDPKPEFDDYSKGSNKLRDKKCIITEGDSGIGRDVAVAFAIQGADVAILHHPDKKKMQNLQPVIFKKTLRINNGDFMEKNYQYDKIQKEVLCSTSS